MKRSVIQLAGKTYVISLPSKWVKQYNIKKGDELDISEDCNDAGCLKISKGNQEQLQKKISVDVSGFNATLIWHTVLALYKDGYDEIEMHFDNLETRYERTGETILLLHLFQDIIDYCLGMEIIRHGKKSCAIKEVSKMSNNEFDTLFRRIHYSILNLLSEGNKAIKDKDYELLKTLTEHSEKNLNKITATCIRVYNKAGTIPSHWLVLTYNLENLGDCIEKTYLSVANSKDNLNEELKQLLFLCQDIFARYSNIFFKNSLKDINKLHIDIVHLKMKIEKLKVKNNDEYLYLNHILHFFEILTDSIGVGIPSHLQYNEGNLKTSEVLK